MKTIERQLQLCTVLTKYMTSQSRMDLSSPGQKLYACIFDTYVLFTQSQVSFFERRTYNNHEKKLF